MLQRASIILFTSKKSNGVSYRQLINIYSNFDFIKKQSGVYLLKPGRFVFAYIYIYIFFVICIILMMVILSIKSPIKKKNSYKS